MRPVLRGWLALWLWCLSGCGTKDESPVLATVGDTEITAADLHDFVERLPAGLKTDRNGAEGYLDYLQTLIDKEIYLQEARSRGLDRLPEFLRKLQREQDDRILRVFVDREIASKIAVDEQELQARFLQTGRNREVAIRQIVVATRAQADDLRRALKRGASFPELARTRSMHQLSAARGGEVKGYLKKDQMGAQMRERVFPLRIGELSEPVELPDGYYGVFEVTDERPVELTAVRDLLRAEITKEKAAPVAGLLNAKLRKQFDCQPREAGRQWLVERLAQKTVSFSEIDRQTVLCQTAGGEITVGDFVDLAQSGGMRFVRNVPQQVDWFVDEVLVPRALYLLAARREGIDRDEEIVRWHRRRQESMLLLALRRTAVKETVAVSDDEVHAYYVQHPEMFTPPETITIQEILARTEDEAAALKERIERGEDMAQLAREHTQRVIGKGEGGIFRINSFEKPFHGDLFEAAQEARVGQLNGPLALSVPASHVLDGDESRGDRYYSVYRLLDATRQPAPEPFATAQKRARALVRRQQESIIADQFLQGLRRQYEPRVRVHNQAVEALAGQ